MNTNAGEENAALNDGSWDGELIVVDARGQHWLATWHPPDESPEGKRHGSTAACFTSDGQVVMVTANGETWELPAGRPEGGEDWRATMIREVMEEACALVERSLLIAFLRGECLDGEEAGLVLVRALWRADVSLLPWSPAHEMVARRLVQPLEVPSFATGGFDPIYRRLISEALRYDQRAPNW